MLSPVTQNLNRGCEQRIHQIFQNVNPESCPYTYNFHLHTVHSDGQLQPIQLIEQATKIGLKDLAITDHHTITGYKIAAQWLADRAAQINDPPVLWVGAEVTSQLLGTEVHILAYDFYLDHPALEIYLQGEAPAGAASYAEQVIAAIHQARGVAVLAHPARYKISAAQLIPAAAAIGIDGVETYYSYNNHHPWQYSPIPCAEVKQLSDIYGLLNTCGTDSHGTDILRRL
jgi:predicted metal-dependent phosphoesterase TrpH